MRGNSSPSAVETVWTTLTVVVTAWSLLAVGLARLGLFRWWTVFAISLLAWGSGWPFWRPRSAKPPFKLQEALFLLVLLAAGLILFARPAEHFPQMGDASIYPNTAWKLIDTGGLVYHYDPLDGLSPQQKQLFYVPSNEQLPYIDIQSYEGLLYGAYYVMDPGQNTVVASRPPLAITWMGLFGFLDGPRGMLYVTPLFGVASLLTLYFLGNRLFDARSGALAALWLLLSFPQLHFSRAPYAEIIGQFFVLTAMYALVAYLQTASMRYLPLGLAALTAGFSARLDVMLFAPVLFLFVFFLLLRRDGRGLAGCAIGAVVGLGFTAWTINRPYVGATGELLLVGQLGFLRRMSPYLAIGLSMGGVLGAVALLRLVRRSAIIRLSVFLRWALSIMVILVVAYALHVRPLTPAYVTVGEEAFATHNEELMAVTAQYMSYPFFWLAALGMILLFWQRRIGHDQLLFGFFVAFFATGFFWKYTTASVYPVALRRLVPEVLPGCALLGTFALRQLSNRGRRWKWSGFALAGLVAVLLVSLGGPYWFHRGAEGAWKTIDELADSIPSDAMLLFEPRTQGSVVGWFAAPLWSFYGREALLLNSDELNGDVLTKTVCFWQNQHRDIYVVSQQAPTSWWPGEFAGRGEGKVVWDSSIIGQSRRFPPYVWRFSFTFVIYKLEKAPCSGN
ncbi:MAG: glycosyltransferase family 39 protein [Chloroflexota bacterium]|nr:glycosyltransferase family 39 protein [Chloroflexota bacterium]